MSAIGRVSIFIFCVLATLTPNGLSRRQTEAYAFNVSAAANLDPVSALDAVKPSGAVDRQIHFVPNSYKFWTNPAHATTHLTRKLPLAVMRWRSLEMAEGLERGRLLRSRGICRKSSEMLHRDSLSPRMASRNEGEQWNPQTSQS